MFLSSTCAASSRSQKQQQPRHHYSASYCHGHTRYQYHRFPTAPPFADANLPSVLFLICQCSAAIGLCLISSSLILLTIIFAFADISIVAAFLPTKQQLCTPPLRCRQVIAGGAAGGGAAGGGAAGGGGGAAVFWGRGAAAGPMQ